MLYVYLEEDNTTSRSLTKMILGCCNCLFMHMFNNYYGRHYGIALTRILIFLMIANYQLSLPSTFLAEVIMFTSNQKGNIMKSNSFDARIADLILLKSFATIKQMSPI